MNKWWESNWFAEWLRLARSILFLATLNTFAVDIYVVHTNNTTTTYTAPLNTDISRGLTLALAVSNGAAGDRLFLTNTVFDLGSTNRLQLQSVSPGMSLIGAGQTNTEVKTQCDFAVVGNAFIQVGTNTLVRDLTITSRAGSNKFSFPIGIFHGPPATGVVLSNLIIHGNSDCIYAFTTNACSMSFYNLTMDANYDCYNVGSAGGVYIISNCVSVSTATVASGFPEHGFGATLDDGTFNIYDSTFTGQSGNSDNNGILLNGGTLNIFRGSASAIGTNACDINIGSGAINARNVRYVTSCGLPVNNIGRVYFIDNSSGNDANSGLSISSPFQRAPQMRTFSGTYSHLAGDQFIFKGGVTWPGTTFQMRIRQGGSSDSIRDYYGVDTNWFAGGSWSKPVFDFQWTTVTNKEGNTGNQDSAGILIDGFTNEVSFVTFDRITMKHHLGDPTFGNCTFLFRGHYTFNTIQNCDFQDWDIANIATDQSNSGGVFQKDNLIAINDNVITNCTFSCSNSTNKTGIALSGWYGSIANSQFFDLSNMLLGFARDAYGNRFWNQVACSNTNLHDNAVYWQNQGRFYGNYVSNCLGGIYVSSLTYSGTLCNTNTGAGMALIYNNVVSGTGRAELEIDQEGVTPQNFGVWAWNNTLQRSVGPAIRVNAKSHMAFFGYGNNHLIGQTNSVQIDNSSFINQPVVSFNNLTQTLATANGQGYNNSNSFSPTASSNSTVGAGSSAVSPYFQVDILGVTRSPLWDIGAYNFNNTTPLPPMNIIVGAEIRGAKL